MEHSGFIVSSYLLCQVLFHQLYFLREIPSPRGMPSLSIATRVWVLPKASCLPLTQTGSGGGLYNRPAVGLWPLQEPRPSCNAVSQFLLFQLDGFSPPSGVFL